MPFDDIRFNRIKAGTAEHSQMKTLIDKLMLGWPNEKSQCPNNVLQFWNCRDEPSVAHGVFFKGSKSVIPKKVSSNTIKSMVIKV